MLAGRPVAQWREAVDIIEAHPEEDLPLTIGRAGGRLDLVARTLADVVKDSAGEHKVGKLRMGPDLPERHEPLSFGKALSQGAKQTVSASTTVVRVVRGMFSGRVSTREVGGPIAIGIQAGQAAQLGIVAFLAFLATISVNLAVLNLLPIPVLDGGQFLFLVGEGILRRPSRSSSGNGSPWSDWCCCSADDPGLLERHSQSPGPHVGGEMTHSLRFALFGVGFLAAGGRALAGQAPAGNGARPIGLTDYYRLITVSDSSPVSRRAPGRLRPHPHRRGGEPASERALDRSHRRLLAADPPHRSFLLSDRAFVQSRRPAPGLPLGPTHPRALRRGGPGLVPGYDQTGEAFQIPGVKDLPVWSPDGKWMALTLPTPPPAGRHPRNPRWSGISKSVSPGG
jgi:hypothetical protein